MAVFYRRWVAVLALLRVVFHVIQDVSPVIHPCLNWIVASAMHGVGAIERFRLDDSETYPRPGSPYFPLSGKTGHDASSVCAAT